MKIRAGKFVYDALCEGQRLRPKTRSEDRQNENYKITEPPTSRPMRRLFS